MRSIGERREAILKFMSEHPNGVSTAEIIAGAKVTKEEWVPVFTQLKKANAIVMIGTRGKARWVHRKPEKTPAFNSIWSFADYAGLHHTVAG